jgi:hypothetical protein
MNRALTFVVAISAAVLSSCGSNLTDAEKKTAAAAVGGLQGIAASNGRGLLDREESRQLVRELRSQRECNAVSETTVPGNTALKYTVECPSGASGPIKVTLTGIGPFEGTCGTETYTAKDISVVLTITVTTRISFSYVMDMTATANDKPLVCKFSMSSDGTSAASYGDFDCTYNGADLDSADLALVSCATR